MENQELAKGTAAQFVNNLSGALIAKGRVPSEDFGLP
jgi:hypothetical protein